MGATAPHFTCVTTYIIYKYWMTLLKLYMVAT